MLRAGEIPSRYCSTVEKRGEKCILRMQQVFFRLVDATGRRVAPSDTSSPLWTGGQGKNITLRELAISTRSVTWYCRNRSLTLRWSSSVSLAGQQSV